MSQIESLLTKLNYFLQKNGINPVVTESLDYKDILKATLSLIWQKVTNKNKREIFLKNIVILFESFYGNIISVSKEIVDRLNVDYPADEDFSELYKESLDDYNVLISDFNRDKSLKIEFYRKISVKLEKLVVKFRNDIIRYMSVHNAEVNPQVLHGLHSTILAMIGGHELKLGQDELVDLGVAGLLHDIGMFMIPDRIVSKKTKLTDEEFNVIKTHAGTAYKMLMTDSEISKEILDAVAQHHEQFDGNGYPRKLKGDEICKFAKILSIADSFEAQISPRVYREAKNSYVAMKDVISSSSNKFDPVILKAFLTSISIYPPGTLIQLNDYSVGIVYGINSDAPLRPVIRQIIDSLGNKCSGKVIVNLKNNPALYIAQVLNKAQYTRKSV